MKRVVVVADEMHERGLTWLEERNGFEVVSTVKEPERLAEALSRADALLVRSATQVTESLLNVAPRLRVIGRAGIGVDNIDVDVATRRGIAVLNAPGANTVSAAEHTIALLLALVRRVPWAVESMRRGEWERSQFGGTELRGKTMGLIGLGRIGVQVAGLGRAFGMSVLAYDPYLTDSRAKQLHVRPCTLETLLREADVISMHAPLTDETRCMLDAEHLALLKPTTVVVNTARGALIDDEALVAAVENGQLAGAALDVFVDEPLPTDSVLRRSDRILLTPHLAATTQEAQERVSVEICQSVIHALETGDVGRAVNVPGVSSEVLGRAGDALDLARRLGRLAGCLSRRGLDSIEVYYGGRDEEVAKPAMLCAIEGVLGSIGVRPVSLVNARILAEERNIALSRRIGRPRSGFETSIGVVVASGDQRVDVVGVVDSPRVSRIVSVNGFDMDVPARGYIVVLRNRDVPGVIGRVGTMLGDAKVNIAFYHQSRSRPPAGNGEALAAIAVDEPPPVEVLKGLEAMQDVLEVRLALLEGD